MATKVKQDTSIVRQTRNGNHRRHTEQWVNSTVTIPKHNEFFLSSMTDYAITFNQTRGARTRAQAKYQTKTDIRPLAQIRIALDDPTPLDDDVCRHETWAVRICGGADDSLRRRRGLQRATLLDPRRGRRLREWWTFHHSTIPKLYPMKNLGRAMNIMLDTFSRSVLCTRRLFCCVCVCLFCVVRF